MPSFLGKVRRTLGRMPVIGSAVQDLYKRYLLWRFPGSQSYWIDRYAQGGNSGVGSYSVLAEYKAEILNRFVTEHQVASVIEFGCGDGNQLRLANYPQYTGFDISPAALARCRQLFPGDLTKSFREMKGYQGESADLTLSLDVIYHLIEDDVFDDYMHKLFRASTRYVIIYSSNRTEQDEELGTHVKHRKFTLWIEANMRDWKLIQHIPNRYPPTKAANTGSLADFFIFEQVRDAS
jgi:SAM-dependent methyltransferase